MGCKEQRSLSFLFNRNVLSRAQSVLLDSDHFLYPEFLMLPSGSCYRLPKMKSKPIQIFICSLCNSVVKWSLRESVREIYCILFIYFYVFMSWNVLYGSAVFLILAASKLPVRDLNKV